MIRAQVVYYTALRPKTLTLNPLIPKPQHDLTGIGMLGSGVYGLGHRVSAFITRPLNPKLYYF